MKKAMIHILGTIILLGIGCILFKVGIETLPRNILDIIFSRIVIYTVGLISLLVIVDTQRLKIPYWWLWFLGVFILMPIFLPLYLIRRSRL